MKISVVILFLCLLFGSFSCTSRRIVRLPPTATLPEILSRITERDAKIKTLLGEGTVTFESPDASTSGYFTARIKKPDSLLFEVHGPFGIRVGTLSIAGEKYVFYDWIENRAVSGKADNSTLTDLLRIPLDIGTVFRAFTGEFMLNDGSEELVTQSSEEHSWRFTYKSADGTSDYWVDYESFIVTGYRRLNRDGTKVMSASVSEIEEIDDIYCGKVVRIVLPQTDQSVTVAYDDISVNTTFTCSFNPPRNARIIYR